MTAGEARATLRLQGFVIGGGAILGVGAGLGAAAGFGAGGWSLDSLSCIETFSFDAWSTLLDGTNAGVAVLRVAGVDRLGVSFGVSVFECAVPAPFVMGDAGAVLALVVAVLPLVVPSAVGLVAGVKTLVGAAGSPQAGLAGAAFDGVCCIRVVEFDAVPFTSLVSCPLLLFPFVLVGAANTEDVFVAEGVTEATPFFPFVPATPTDAFLSSADCAPLLLSPAFSLCGLSRQLRELLPLSFSVSLSL